MTVSLRPHHLLCILTYLGKGYTPDFVSNYDRIIQRLNAGEAIRLVAGPDDLCQPMLDEPGCHCLNDSVRERDVLALEDIGNHLGGMPASGGPFLLDAGHVARLRSAFSSGALRRACHGCEWRDLCSRIARNSYRDCKLAVPV